MGQFIQGWYVIYTRPNHEKKVFNQLSDLGIDVFFPTRKVVRTWSDRRKYIDRALFPGYLFIYIKDQMTYFHGLNAEGFLYYLKSGNKLSLVKDETISYIKLASKFSDVEIPDCQVLPGTKIMIKEGAFTGMICEVVKHNSETKILVRVDLLSRNLLISVPKENIYIN